MSIDQFVETLHHDPRGRTAVRKLRNQFLQRLPEREKSLWPRWRFVQELEAHGLRVGLDSSNIATVPGVTLEPPAKWVVGSDGYLVKA